MTTRQEIINMLKSESPGTPDMMIETIVDVYMRDPEWIKNKVRDMQREDKKGRKHVEPEPKQAIFYSVDVEHEVTENQP